MTGEIGGSLGKAEFISLAMQTGTQERRPIENGEYEA